MLRCTWASLLAFALTLTLQSSLAQSAASTNSDDRGDTDGDTLDGYAFDCGGLLLGFQGMDQIVCLTGGTEVMCGTYAYDEGSAALTGRTSLTGRFLAFSLEIHDSILVSFRSDLGNSCHAVTLDWRKYSALSYMGLSCPEQNEIHPNNNNDHHHHRDHSLLLAYETNHFSLGISGDVALRSPLLFSSGRRLVRDSYGIYKYHAGTESIRLYFGQQGQLHQGATLILDGRLTKEGDLFLPAHVQSGQPCRHDGQSLIHNVTELPSTANTDWVKAERGNRNLKRISRHRVMDEEASSAMTMATERIIYWILITFSFVGLGVMARR